MTLLEPARGGMVGAAGQTVTPRLARGTRGKGRTIPQHPSPGHRMPRHCDGHGHRGGNGYTLCNDLQGALHVDSYVTRCLRTVFGVCGIQEHVAFTLKLIVWCGIECKMSKFRFSVE